MIVFTKLRPLDTWGNFDFKVDINKGSPIISAPSQYAQPMGQDAAAGGQAYGYQQPDFNHNPDIVMIPADDFKACPGCTFHNPNHLFNCEMCGSNL
jgi:hypothetical protein